MTEKLNIFKKVRDFFKLEELWLKKYLGLILVSIILGTVSGFLMVGFFLFINDF